VEDVIEMSRKTQYVMFCHGCNEPTQYVNFEFVDNTGRAGIDEVSIHCSECNTELMVGV
jgi:RNase P subunit RPR2